MAEAWPFVGRADLLSELVAAVVAPGIGALVEAGPGCGASRALAETSARLRRAGRRVIDVRATADRAGVAGSALAGDPGPMPDGRGAEDGTATALRAAARLDVASGDDPPVAVVDDAHWLDETSAALLGGCGAGGRVQLVVGVGRGRRLPTSLLALLRDPRVVRTVLDPLTEEDLRALLAVALGGPVSPRLAAEVGALTGGRPATLRAALAAATAHGAISRVRGTWDLAPGTDTLVAGTAASSAALVEDLPAEARRALEVVVVAGRGVALDVLEPLVGLDALAGLEERDLLLLEEEAGGPVVRLRTPSLASALPPLPAEVRRAHLSDLVAVHEARQDPGGAGDGDIVAWRLDAGLPVDAGRARRAGQAALAAGDAARAERLASVAWADGTDAEAGLVVGLARWHRGQVAEAARVLDAAAAVAVDEATRDAIARQQVVVHLIASDDRTAAQAALDRIAATRAGALGAGLGYLALLAGWSRRAVDDAEGWLGRAGPDAPDADQARFVAVMGRALVGRPAPEVARRDPAAAAVARPSATGDVLAWDLALGWAGIAARLYQGALAEAADRADALRATADQAGDQAIPGWASVLAGVAHLQGGHLARSQETWIDAWRAFVPRGHDSRLRIVQAGLVAVESFGSPQVAGLTGFGWFDSLSEGPAWFLEGERARLTVLGEVARDPSAAVAPLRAVLEAVDEREVRVHALLLRYLLSLVAPGDTANQEVLRVGGAEVVGPWVASCAADATARAAGDRDGHLDAVDALLATGDRVHARLSLLSVRDGWDGTGPIRGADRRALDQRLREISRGSDLPLPGDLAAPARERLTARELAIAERAVAGSTSREVAGALGVSPRTVENTLRTVYRKLGCTGRTDLAGALGSDPEG